jgi:hypothetical protein
MVLAYGMRRALVVQWEDTQVRTHFLSYQSLFTKFYCCKVQVVYVYQDSLG